jgi:hypothetical protein
MQGFSHFPTCLADDLCGSGTRAMLLDLFVEVDADIQGGGQD